MNRKIWIASAVTLVGLLSGVAPVGASAGSPLLSGYGGPGAGEQAIVGSTLLGGPRGGAGSGGSSGSSGGGAVTGTSSTSGVASDRGGVNGAKPTGGTSASGTGSGSHPHRSRAGRSGGAPPARSRAYVYPSTPASPQGDSSALGLTSGDLFVLIAIAVTLGLIGVLTVRLSRLQP